MTASELQKSPPDIIRMLGAEWKRLPEAQKQPYNDKYEKLKVCIRSSKKNENACGHHDAEWSGWARQGDGEVDREDDEGGENVRWRVFLK